MIDSCMAFLLLPPFVLFFLCSHRLLGECLMPVEDFLYLLNNWVVLVDILCPCLFVEYIVDDAAVDVTVEQLMALANQQITAL